MAEIILTCLIRKLTELLVQDLHDLLREEVAFLRRVRRDVQLLRDKLQYMNGLLKDVSGTPSRSERASIWIEQIRDTALDAEDVIDTFIVEVEQRRQQRGISNGGTVIGHLGRITGRARDVPALHCIGNKIADINQRLDTIARSRRDLATDDTIPPAAGRPHRLRPGQGQPQRVRIADGSDVVGMEVDARRLQGRLMERRVRRRAVISITGMGGIGKTTLAKKVFNSDDVKRHFTARAWMTLPRDYQVAELLFLLINCFTPLSRDEMQAMDEERLQQKLFGYLEEERYLIVLDDVWDRDVWRGLADGFPDKKNGSRVMLTTRNELLASFADPQSPTHQMRLLDKPNSWKLFCKMAFPESTDDVDQDPCPPYLLPLGKKIVEKCQGLPLAISVMGSLLSGRHGEEEWRNVSYRINWWLQHSPDQISGVLEHSYYDLPYYLKPCFLYLGAFNGDSEASADALVRLWISEGFVEKRDGHELEDVAEAYLVELANRSMIQVRSWKTNGAIQTCSVHDLLRDLSIKIAARENFLTVTDTTTDPQSSILARRLAINQHGIGQFISPNYAHLRSFLCFAQEQEIPQLESVKIACRSFKLLRVLNLQHVKLASLPDDIGSLIHLRYFSLRGSGDKLTTLPATITRLYNLQTLDLRHTHIQSLPKNIYRLRQLRHLLIWHEYHSRFGACEISRDMKIEMLSNLQTLLVVEAGGWIEDDLPRLTKLRDLHVEGDLVSHEEQLTRCIAQLLGLRSLHLDVAYRGVYIENRRVERRLQIPALQSFSNHAFLYKMVLVGRLQRLLDVNHFPPYLSELCLRHSRLEDNPMRALKNLRSLRILTLDVESYVGSEMNCSDGGFPQLQRLRMIGLCGLEEWRMQPGAMADLRYLEINQCSSLRMLPEGLQQIGNLEEVVIVRMPHHFKERMRKNMGADWPKIQHVPFLFVTDVVSHHLYHGPYNNIDV